MNFRKSTADDVPQLVELRKKQLIDEGAAETNIDGELERFFAEELKSGTLIVWLATENAETEQIIATAGVCFFQYPPSFTNKTGKIVYITNIYTKPEFRRQGIAAKLLELVLKEAENKGCAFARLHASEQGKKLYEKFGFDDAQGFMIKKLQSVTEF